MQNLPLTTVVRRDGQQMPFAPDKIRVAIENAFLADADSQVRRPDTYSDAVVLDLTEQVITTLDTRFRGLSIHCRSMWKRSRIWLRLC